MKKLNFLQKRSNFNLCLFLVFSLLSSCTSHLVEAKYKYATETNQIIVNYYNNTDVNYFLIVPKILFLDPYDSNKIIKGMDGIYLRKKAQIFYDDKLLTNRMSYINNKFSEFYFLLSIRENENVEIKYSLSDPMDNQKFQKYKIYLTTTEDFKSPIFRDNFEQFKKMNNKNFIPYTDEIEYSGDLVIIK